jgi:hypothetical protein
MIYQYMDFCITFITSANSEKRFNHYFNSYPPTLCLEVTAPYQDLY